MLAAALSGIAGREHEFLLSCLRQKNRGPASSPVLEAVGELIGRSQDGNHLAGHLRVLLTTLDNAELDEAASLLVGWRQAQRLRSGESQPALPGLIQDLRQHSPQLTDRIDAWCTQARQLAVSGSESTGRRALAISLLAEANPAQVVDLVPTLLDAAQAPEIWTAAARAARLADDTTLAAKLLEADRFGTYSPRLREEVLSAVMAQPDYQGVLLDALEQGAVPTGTIDAQRRRQMTEHGDPARRERALRLLAPQNAGDRFQVYEDYKTVVDLSAQPAHGRQLFIKHCANCHRLDREGVAVGPDLHGMRKQPKEAILLHILIPEYEINPAFAPYVLETTDGRVFVGLLSQDTPEQVTLRQALGKEETVLREHIASLTLSKLSLMPQELEKLMSRQELADLLAFLKGEQ